jgi:SAM-dependent methyltransferase
VRASAPSLPPCADPENGGAGFSERGPESRKEQQMAEPLRLNIGGGAIEFPGFLTIDRKNGFDAYPLKRTHERSGSMFADNSVDEVIASHVLEHFSHQDSVKALQEWVRVLKPGGRIRLSVPDFAKCAQAYLDGQEMPIAGYVMGGQTDDDDFHKTLFDEQRLRQLMEFCGLGQIEPWEPAGLCARYNIAPDNFCACNPISVNLQGVKGAAVDKPKPKVSAVISLPRYGPTKYFNALYQALVPLGIPIEMQWGAFWEHRLTNAMENAIEAGAEYILTLDYDSPPSSEDIRALITLMDAHPEADAIAPVQIKREENTALFRPVNADGSYKTGDVPLTDFDGDLTEVGWAHFGLTLIRVSALKKMKKPWFLGVPDEKGGWSDHATHPDIFFWNNLRASGGKLFIANHVAIPHMQDIAVHVNQDLNGAVFQYMGDFQRNGKPEGARR